MTLVFDGRDGWHMNTDGSMTLTDTNLYVGAEVYNILNGKDYIVVNVESDWTARLEEVER